MDNNILLSKSETTSDIIFSFINKEKAYNKLKHFYNKNVAIADSFFVTRLIEECERLLPNHSIVSELKSITNTEVLADNSLLSSLGSPIETEMNFVVIIIDHDQFKNTMQEIQYLIGEEKSDLLKSDFHFNVLPFEINSLLSLMKS